MAEDSVSTSIHRVPISTTTTETQPQRLNALNHHRQDGENFLKESLCLRLADDLVLVAS